MAKPRSTLGPLQVNVEYLFDRLHESKLVQAYSLLVPVRERPVGGSVKELDHEDGSNLRTGIFRPAAGGEHNCEPDGVPDRVCLGARSGGTRRVGLRG
jgi:hypothetical protein